ncbi:MAG: threonine/serine dehydratase, partial [Ktedonobacterales bacterium]
MPLDARAELVAVDDIRAAAARIAPYLHRTPVMSATALGERVGARLVLKAELFQKTGSFKPRGALNTLLRLGDAERARGVISISAGNHAQGVAYAAGILGIAATVVMPDAAVRSKVEATRGYGAEVILHGSGKDLLPKARALQAERGLTFIAPFDDPDVIAGQGTVGLELLEDAPGLDVVVVPVGGGGLISGVAAAVKGLRPEARVIGVEPVGAACMMKSLRAGAAAQSDPPETIADGLAAPFAGELNFLHVQRLVDDVVLVTDDEIIAALRLLLERAKLQAEPSGAAAYAALLAGK